MTPSPNTQNYDVVIIGGGAAGLLAGIFAAERFCRVAIVERNEKPGKKLRITGKGRCNVANACDMETFLANVRQGGRFLYSSYSAFSCDDVMAFFEDRGVPLKVERGGRVFPQSDKAQDIVDTLVNGAKDAGCVILHDRVTAVRQQDGAVCGVKLQSGENLDCRGVIVATGGLSYPLTGSTGDGYAMAKALGHTVKEPRGSLVPLVCEGEDCPAMMGLSLKNVTLTAKLGKKTVFSEMGEMLFTHFGISGPLVLRMSGLLLDKDLEKLDVWVDLKPALDEGTLDKRLVRDFTENPNKDFRNSLDALLPKKMIPVVVERSGIDPYKKVNAVTAAERRQLAAVIKRFGLKVTGFRPVEEAIITAGGVTLKEIDPKTMESKYIQNLHFAGEVLDADAYTGGFNLGIAFATAHAAGVHILEKEETT